MNFTKKNSNPGWDNAILGHIFQKVVETHERKPTENWHRLGISPKGRLLQGACSQDSAQQPLASKKIQRPASMPQQRASFQP